MTQSTGKSALPALDGTKLVLLGTKGGPRPSRSRSNPANLIMAAGRLCLIDCGYGVTRQLLEIGVQPQEVRTILITHHHSDHTLELGPLLYNAWVGGLRDAIDVWGPPPLQELLDGFFRSMSYDIGIRIADEGRVDPRRLVRVHEFEACGVVFEVEGLIVSATKVRHPPLSHAYAYRFDTPGRSIVLSGDTAPCPELIELARGADVLVHEVMSLAGMERLVAGAPHAAALRAHLLASHTTTDEVGAVAAAAAVKMFVLNHFVPGDDASITDEMWLAGPRKSFNGLLVAGTDLLVI